MVLNDIIRMIEKAFGQPANIRYQERHAADPMMTWADIGRAGHLLGWTPIVDIEEGIGRTAQWYKEHSHWARTLA